MWPTATTTSGLHANARASTTRHWSITRKHWRSGSNNWGRSILLWPSATTTSGACTITRASTTRHWSITRKHWRFSSNNWGRSILLWPAATTTSGRCTAKQGRVRQGTGALPEITGDPAQTTGAGASFCGHQLQQHGLCLQSQEGFGQGQGVLGESLCDFFRETGPKPSKYEAPKGQLDALKE